MLHQFKALTGNPTQSHSLALASEKWGYNCNQVRPRRSTSLDPPTHQMRTRGRLFHKAFNIFYLLYTEYLYTSITPLYCCYARTYTVYTIHIYIYRVQYKPIISLKGFFSTPGMTHSFLMRRLNERVTCKRLQHGIG